MNCNIFVHLIFSNRRTLGLLLMTCLYLGRVDEAFVSPGVNVIWYDNYPNTFTSDLLIHEAHRHPYIERLGLIYLLKIHHGDAFASRAGCRWRLLFTLALCPWLHRYRKHEMIANDEVIDDLISTKH